MTETPDIRCETPCLYCHGEGPNPRSRDTDYDAWRAHTMTNFRREAAGLEPITKPPRKERVCKGCAAPLDNPDRWRPDECDTCYGRVRWHRWRERQIELAELKKEA